MELFGEEARLKHVQKVQVDGVLPIGATGGHIAGDDIGQTRCASSLPDGRSSYGFD